MNKINFVHVLHLYYIVREGYVGTLNTHRLGGREKIRFINKFLVFDSELVIETGCHINIMACTGQTTLNNNTYIFRSGIKLNFILFRSGLFNDTSRIRPITCRNIIVYYCNVCILLVYTLIRIKKKTVSYT